MGLLRAAASLGVHAVHEGTRLATLPLRGGVLVTLVVYEELLDVAERSGLVEPPDPPAGEVARPEHRRPAA